VVAGGTDILPDIQKGKRGPDCLVDITRIPELSTIDVSGGWATVGAAVPFVALREHPYFAARVHALVDAAASVGALAIQTSATWVGNLVQAMPAADGAIIAIALDAQVRVLDAAGERWLPVPELYAGPGRSRIDPTRELVTHIRFATPPGSGRPDAWGTAWRRAGRRPSLVLPTLNCAVKVVIGRGGRSGRASLRWPSGRGGRGGERIVKAAIAMGPVGPCPVRAHEAESFLAGREPQPEVLAEAAQLALCDADPRSNLLRASREYRLAVLPALITDALAEAVARAQL
jgi:carbon-monoxide dehydrogenase medium subunit